MCGSNFYGSDVIRLTKNLSLKSIISKVTKKVLGKILWIILILILILDHIHQRLSEYICKKTNVYNIDSDSLIEV